MLDLHVNSGILVNEVILTVNTHTHNQTDSLFEHLRNHSGNGRSNEAMILDVNRANSHTQDSFMKDNGNREAETNDNQQSMVLGNADLYEPSCISSASNSSKCEVNSTRNSSSFTTGIENVSSLQHAWSANESLMLYTNADALMNKRDELETLISINKYDIVVITEVLPKNRISSTISDTEFHINGNVQHRAKL